MVKDINEQKPQIAETKLPHDKTYAIVQCSDFRCLAYKTPEGKWKSAYQHEELNDAAPVSEYS